MQQEMKSISIQATFCYCHFDHAIQLLPRSNITRMVNGAFLLGSEWEIVENAESWTSKLNYFIASNNSRGTTKWETKASLNSVHFHSCINKLKSRSNTTMMVMNLYAMEIKLFQLTTGPTLDHHTTPSNRPLISVDSIKMEIQWAGK